ncbi:acetyl-CoA/propionyl-CoA carboxylase, biotin carboxylase, biotin carboxyl carrier protein [Thermomonospora echinospora]|uniref:Biotin-dependent 3-methylcrotonyl-coenzyme A carboxylase alpha1 subunit n=1 Tax=Thermomonospora echinospora TaxID=1992 RepID=A0A1H6D5C4_9ACTN|nr:biotin carboxylase N-terminal domain-containing protein [Thermomonospora echinospora]SEG80510.1 acetyl-CoA/propionyl-CoA carboxylase, biotin carboxylase, biotin carboxyl carrier protein [Thermomonospora echinospora]
MFETVLIANRGEIAVRVARTLRRLGVRSVAVHTDADAGARHVREADEAVRVTGYLDIASVVQAARASGAQAVHPGYGFLAENTAFAAACAEAGLVFVGPPAAAIEAMGDKIRAKRTVAAAGVPVVPGRDEPGLSDAELAEAAHQVGLPVLIKPSAGGGGKGMRLVREAGELAEAIASARREARGAFGDDTLLVERFVANPRHIEIQVFADAHGNAVHLGERECSLQRRHQKIVEEAPSPLLDEATRERMGAAAVAAARAVGYTGAGTVEYIVSADRPDEYFFMEMNTRLQVEHPVTELVTGLDLVELQLRVAAGEPLPFTQADVRLAGHAVEARVYAEDPTRGFLPTGGRVLALREPDGAHVRVDSGVAEGDEVGSSYDPMLAKVIAWGEDRAAALRRLDRALASYTLLGVPSNVAFLRALLAHPDVAAGRLDTGLVERELAAQETAAAARPDAPSGPGRLLTTGVPDEVPAAAALERTLALESDDPDPWAIPDGWRLSGAAWTPWIITPAGGTPVEVRVRGRAAAAEILIADAGAPDGRAETPTDDGGPVPASLSRDGDRLRLTFGGRTTAFTCARDGDTLWLGRDGHTWALAEHVRGEQAEAGAAGAGDGVLRSPMPGTVLAVKAAEGDRVTAGQPLVVVEAMKMEHTVTAPMDGVVSRLPVRTGAQVALDAVLAEITAEEAQQ